MRCASAWASSSARPATSLDRFTPVATEMHSTAGARVAQVLAPHMVQRWAPSTTVFGAPMSFMPAVYTTPAMRKPTNQA